MTRGRPIDGAFDAEARSISEAHEQWYADLAAFNRAEEKTGAAMDVLLAHAAEIDARRDALRRDYFPRASRLIVQHGGALTVSAAGRTTRRVWSASAAVVTGS